MLTQGVADSLDLVPIAAYEGKGKRKGQRCIYPLGLMWCMGVGIKHWFRVRVRVSVVGSALGLTLTTTNTSRCMGIVPDGRMVRGLNAFPDRLQSRVRIHRG